MRFETVRLLLALAAIENWDILALDVKSAFLYGTLKEDIYMQAPKMFAKDKSKVWRLHKAIYRLKQASREWWTECSNYMKSLGFTKLESDGGVYYFIEKTSIIIAIIYVDDALWFSNNRSLLDKKREQFKEKYETTDLGEPTEFLGM